MTQFEKWAFDPKGGNWAKDPRKPANDKPYFDELEVFIYEEIAFNAGIAEEKARVQKFLDDEMTRISKLDMSPLEMLPVFHLINDIKKRLI